MKNIVKLSGSLFVFFAIFIANMGSALLCGEETLPESLR